MPKVEKFKQTKWLTNKGPGLRFKVKYEMSYWYECPKKLNINIYNIYKQESISLSITRQRDVLKKNSKMELNKIR
jgi:hypothetical protein